MEDTQIIKNIIIYIDIGAVQYYNVMLHTVRSGPSQEYGGGETSAGL